MLLGDRGDTDKEEEWSSARRQGEGEGQLVGQVSVGKSYDTDAEEKQKWDKLIAKSCWCLFLLL